MQTACNWKTSNKRRFRTCCVSIDNLNSFCEATSIVEMLLNVAQAQSKTQSELSLLRKALREWVSVKNTTEMKRERWRWNGNKINEKERKNERQIIFKQNKRYKKETKKERKNNDRGTIIKQKKENPRMVSLQKKKV